jgi:outer membrane protein assembly factor BamB
MTLMRYFIPNTNALLTLAFVFLLDLLVSNSMLIAQEHHWPQFRGPDSNPVADNANLPDRWSMTENLDWSVEIPGRGWSSPVVWGDKVLVTTVVSDKESKPAQVGTEYSNQYAAELAGQGLKEDEIMAKLKERDFEMPEEVNASYRLYCLELATGKELWHREYHKGSPPCGRHRKNSFASETPTTDGEMIYVYVANMGVFAFNFAGEAVWNKELPNRPIYLDFGTGSSPILVDNLLIVLNDNEENSELLAFDKKTGEQIWRTQRGEFPEGKKPMQASSWTTPYLWKNSQRSEIVTIGPGRVTSYDLAGKELWRLDAVRPGPASSPFAVGDQLIVNAGAPAPVFAISPGANGDITPVVKELAEAAKKADSERNAKGESADVETGRSAAAIANSNPEGEKAQIEGTKSESSTESSTENVAQNESHSAGPKVIQWMHPRSSAYIPTPLAYKQGLYVLSDNGILTRLNLQTGKESFKKRVKSSGADFTVSPWAYDGKLYVASEQGNVYVLEAGEEFKLLHVNEVGEMMMASPAFAGGRMLVRTEKRLMSIRKS